MSAVVYLPAELAGDAFPEALAEAKAALSKKKLLGANRGLLALCSRWREHPELDDLGSFEIRHWLTIEASLFTEHRKPQSALKLLAALVLIMQDARLRAQIRETPELAREHPGDLCPASIIDAAMNRAWPGFTKRREISETPCEIMHKFLAEVWGEIESLRALEV